MNTKRLLSGFFIAYGCITLLPLLQVLLGIGLLPTVSVIFNSWIVSLSKVISGEMMALLYLTAPLAWLMFGLLNWKQAKLRWAGLLSGSTVILLYGVFFYLMSMAFGDGDTYVTQEEYERAVPPMPVGQMDDIFGFQGTTIHSESKNGVLYETIEWRTSDGKVITAIREDGFVVSKSATGFR